MVAGRAGCGNEGAASVVDISTPTGVNLMDWKRPITGAAENLE